MAEQPIDRELKNALAQIEKQFGKGAHHAAGRERRLDVQGISTGALSLDIALGGKGLPRGRDHRDLRPRVERQDDGRPARRRQRPEARAASPRSSTPSTPSTRPGPSGSASTSRACWSASRPTPRRRCKIAEMLVKSNAVDIIVIDSVAALVPRAEIEGEIGDSHVGLQARLMSQALRMLNADHLADARRA